jgi:hypothetical protein
VVYFRSIFEEEEKHEGRERKNKQRNKRGASVNPYPRSFRPNPGRKQAAGPALAFQLCLDEKGSTPVATLGDNTSCSTHD